MQHRVIGFDVARALALFGMVTVNFRLAMEADSGSPLLLWLAGQFEGRASALFVVLAGVGVSLLTRKAYQTQDPALIKAARWTMARRGLLLFVLGLAYTPIWEADILHFYGVYFILASLVIVVSNRSLLWLVVLFTLVFPVLLLFFNYDAGWNWDTLSYQSFWTWQAMLRRLFFNGFHPVFPWFAFLLWGIWLGRQDFSDRTRRRRFLCWALGIWGLTEGLVAGFHAVLVGHYGLDDLAILLTTSMMPPLPYYVVAAGALATVVIMVSLAAAERWSESSVIIGLKQTGQLSLTLYVAHVVLGMGALHLLGRLGGQDIGSSLIATLIFSLLAVGFSRLWSRYFRLGPLEWVFRTLARPAK